MGKFVPDGTADMFEPAWLARSRAACARRHIVTPPRAQRALPAPSDWSFELIEQYHAVIRSTAERFGLDTYPNQLEIITAEQMMDAYASVGMPVNYRHWSYGKEFIATEKNYKRGHMGLAYEIVINSNPCISYLMEENTMAMQALVIAHAAYGHNSFFKGNYLFRMWTDAASIIDYLVYAKNYVAGCEERHGVDAVEELLDSCHALMSHGVDRYRRPSKLSLAQEQARSKDREAYAQQQINDLWRTLPRRAEKASAEEGGAPLPRGAAGKPAVLHREERAAARALAARDRAHRAQGGAVFLPAAPDAGDERGLGHLLAPQAAQHAVRRRPHVGRHDDRVAEVAHQRGVPAAGGPPAPQRPQPYALGFAMYTDIKRICEVPTDEDRAWFPAIAGSDWLETLDHAMRNFRTRASSASTSAPS